MKMKSWIGVSRVAALGLAASAFISLPAFANGGDFFNELSESWGSNADTGVPFFGWVRDLKGKAIPRAIVTATVVGGVDGEAVTIISDNLGHFKIPGSARISIRRKCWLNAPRRDIAQCRWTGASCGPCRRLRSRLTAKCNPRGPSAKPARVKEFFAP